MIKEQPQSPDFREKFCTKVSFNRVLGTAKLTTAAHFGSVKGAYNCKKAEKF